MALALWESIGRAQWFALYRLGRTCPDRPCAFSFREETRKEALALSDALDFNGCRLDGLLHSG